MSSHREADAAIRVKELRASDRDLALEFLRPRARENLLLVDSLERLGTDPPLAEAAPEVLAAWREGRLVGIASLRPSLLIDDVAPPAVVDAFSPYVTRMRSGLVRSTPEIVERLWRHLGAKSLEAIVDRREKGYALDASRAHLAQRATEVEVRPAVREDVPELVVAARASLREENRPDPYDGAPAHFRRWVRGRMSRARVVEWDGRIAWVGYADVQRPEGWLIQGVYTFPAVRRRGFAAAGISALCAEAFEVGADHVQLAVVEDNEPGEALYHTLGFEPFCELRTVLFG